ncbi:MAG: hypothetical protein GC154_05440 [bacterium]|nr:hypothetical protein [bacterium]
MGRKKEQRDDQAIAMVRLTLGYLWIVVLFGSILLTVQASIEVKRTHYRMTDKYYQKTALLDDLRKLNIEINELERYERIAEKIETEFPELGPPRHPAIEIGVPGLTTQRIGHTPARLPEAETSWIIRMRNRWVETFHSVRGWLNALLD